MDKNRIEKKRGEMMPCIGERMLGGGGSSREERKGEEKEEKRWGRMRKEDGGGKDGWMFGELGRVRSKKETWTSNGHMYIP